MSQVSFTTASKIPMLISITHAYDRVQMNQSTLKKSKGRTVPLLLGDDELASGD
jgi:hypothetical protein